MYVCQKSCTADVEEPWRTKASPERKVRLLEELVRGSGYIASPDTVD